MTEKEMWLKLVCAAAVSYVVPNDFDGETMDDLIEDIADVTEGYADEMLDRFENRYGPIESGAPEQAGRRPNRARGSRGSRAPRGRAPRNETPPTE